MTSHRFDWSTPYPSARLPVFARNIVSTSHPLAAQAGLRAMQQGGNAVDAAIATAAMMMLVEPCSNGLGSDMFCILWDGEKLHGLNASGPAPAAWTPEYFRRKYGADAAQPPQARLGLGHRAGRRGRLGRPVRALRQAAVRRPAGAGDRDRRARLRRADRRAGEMGRGDAAARRRARLGRGLPAARAGRPRSASASRFPAAARSLRAIAETRGAALYGGEIAEAAARHAAANGGAMTVRDFAVVRARMGRDDRHRRLGPSPARDPAQRPGHRRADRPRHRPPSRPRARCRSTAPSASTCRSRR